MLRIRASLKKCMTHTKLRSTHLKLVVAIALLATVYVHFVNPTFRINFFEIGIVKQERTTVSSSRQNSSSLTNILNISKTHVSSKTVAEPVTRPPSSPCPPTSRAARVKTGDLYMTAPFKGRIGNQMFIYATLLGLASSQNRTAFTRSGTILENAFEITHVNNTISTAGFRTVGESKFATFDARLLKLSRENITLAGYFQVWKYFRNIDEYIRREFTLRAAMREQINELLDKFRGDVKGHILVGVHVRRGDLLFSKFKRYGYGVAKASYFMKAFERMRSMLNSSDVTFVVVSDDLEWCHENLNSTDVQILEPGSAVLHFGVLASCDHVIISGGTYGWWAAWLANGITIYYDRFFINGTDLMRGVSLQDYYPPEWVALGD